MKALDYLYRLFLRFRYPVSLPEDIAEALGIPCSNSLSFEQFVQQLCSPECRPTRLKKFMPRADVDFAFSKALRKEHFKQNSLYSYYFNEGWMEFVLFFDDHSRLRRVYLQHKYILQEEGVEIAINCGTCPENLKNQTT